MKLDTTYWLSTTDYNFRYREDRYNRFIIHVEMFKDGKLIHKQMAVATDYNINMSHQDVINTLESKIIMKQLDPTGLKQILPIQKP